MSERNVLGKAMPQANLQLCLFHVLRNFRREITPEKLGITPGEKNCALVILQNRAYSRSEEEYQTFYDKLSNEFPYYVVSYFNRNWHAIRSE
jgi:zinc finger SWIM domain-containing protein 3